MLEFIGVLLPYHVVLVSAVQQSAGEGWACDSGGGEVQLWLPVSYLHLCDQEQQSVTTAQRTDIRRTGSFLPTLALGSCVQAAPGAHAQLPASWLGLADR